MCREKQREGGGGGVGGISRKSTKNNVFFAVSQLLFDKCYKYMHLTLHRKLIIPINFCNVDICTGLLKNFQLSSAKTTVVISHTFANTHIPKTKNIEIYKL